MNRARYGGVEAGVPVVVADGGKRGCENEPSFLRGKMSKAAALEC